MPNIYHRYCIVSKFLFGDNSKEYIVEIPQGQLYLVRPLSVKGYSELIFKDAAAFIRRTSHDFQYELVIQRAYEEGEEELLSETEGEELAVDGQCAEKDDKTFLLDESLEFRSEIYSKGEKVFAWRDLSGDSGDLWEFVCDRSSQSATIAQFELIALQSQYERKYRRSHVNATDSDLEQFRFSKKIPEASPVSNPTSQAPPSPQSDIVIASPEADPSIASEDMAPRRALKPKDELKDDQQNGKEMGNLPTEDKPEDGNVMVRVVAELHLFDLDSGTFMLQDAIVEATVLELGGWKYRIEVFGDKEWLGQEIRDDLNPVFNFEYLSFIFNQYGDDGSAKSWLLRFNDYQTEEQFQQGVMQALWEHLNETKWLDKNTADKKYVLDAFNDLNIGDPNDMAEGEDKDEDEDEHEPEPDDSGTSEQNDNDASDDEDDIIPRDDDNNTNSHLAVGYKDRSYVVRGSNIGVFKHTPDNRLQFSTKISEVKTPNGRRFTPEQIMLHAGDRNLILQNEDTHNSLYRMDLEYGKIVEELKVHEYIPVNHFAPISKFAQMNDEQTFLGLSKNSLYRIDPRLSGEKLVPSELKQYALNSDFSAVSTTEKGFIAVASNKGDIRMFDRLGVKAKTLIPALGDPIIGLDVSSDGRWILATTKNYLLLIDAQQPSGKTGFEKSFPKDSKPRPRRLALSPTHVAQFQQETKAPVSFTPANFNTGLGSDETSIVTATGPFVVSWSMKKVTAGQKDPYSIKRYSEDVKADAFKFGTDKNVIVALSNEVNMVPRRELRRPTRESIMLQQGCGADDIGGIGGMGGSSGTPRRSTRNRGNYISNSNIVNSPY